MSSNLFARFIEVIKRPGFLISRLIIVGILTVFFLLSFVEDPFVVYEMYLPVEGEPDEEVSEYLEKFKSEHNKEELAIHWHPSTGTPTAVFGKLAKFDIASEGNAREFLRKNKDLFKFRDNLEDLTLSRCFESAIGKHFVFEQRYKGKTIAKDGLVEVHFNHNGEIIAINNTYLPNIKLDSVTPNINKEQALAFAKGLLNVKQRVNLGKIKINLKDKDEPVVYLFNKEVKLSWNFVISTLNKSWEIFIDAQNGRCLGNPIDIDQYFAEAEGKVFNVNPIVATQNQNIRPSNIPDTAYKKVILKGLEGNGNVLDGVYASSCTPECIVSPSGNFVYDRNTNHRIFRGTMVYYYVDYTQRYIQETLKLNNINNRKTFYNISYPANSKYISEDKSLHFSNVGIPASEDADIIIHEYGHAIQDDQKPGFGKGNLQNEAISEAFADYLAASIGSHFSKGFGDSVIGEWRNLTDLGSKRNLGNRRRYCDFYTGADKYVNSQIWSATLWEIRKKLLLSGVDADEASSRADKIIILSNFIVTASAGFNQAASAIIELVTDGNYSQQEIELIRNVLKDRGFLQGENQVCN